MSDVVVSVCWALIVTTMLWPTYDWKVHSIPIS
jgi:hypothetical protein